MNNTGRDDHNDRYVGGNFVLKYKDCPLEHTRKHIQLNISSSSFLNGNARSRKESFDILSQIRVTGISVLLSCINISIVLTNVTLCSNEAHSYSSKGGNLYILFENAIDYISNSILVEIAELKMGMLFWEGVLTLLLKHQQKIRGDTDTSGVKIQMLLCSEKP